MFNVHKRTNMRVHLQYARRACFYGNVVSDKLSNSYTHNIHM